MHWWTHRGTSFPSSVCIWPCHYRNNSEHFDKTWLYIWRLSNIRTHQRPLPTQPRLCCFTSGWALKQSVKERARTISHQLNQLNTYLTIQRKKTFQYVPILPLLSQLVDKRHIQNTILQHKRPSEVSSGYKSFNDGALLRQKTFLCEDELPHSSCSTHPLHRWLWGVQPSSRRKRKVTAVYWVFAEIPATLRSTLITQPCHACQSSTVWSCRSSQMWSDELPQCPISDRLSHLHATSGYPPDALHDLLEGILPVEISLCLDVLIRKKYISLQEFNHSICCFPYKWRDKTVDNCTKFHIM